MTFLAFAEGIQLVPDGSIFIHIALILLMIYILNRTLFAPINRILDEREKKTGARGSTAEVLAQAEEKMQVYEKGLRAARSSGYTVIEKTRQEALADRQHQIESVKEEVATMLTQEKTRLQQQVAQTRQQLQTDAQTLAQRIAQTLFGKATV